MAKTAEAPLPLRIYLIRHAESVGNVGQIVTGQSDLPLSDVGREQARRTGLALANRPIEVIYASPLARVWDTALPISQTTGAPIVALDDLREMNCGLAEGLTWAEVEERWPDFA
ncbi:MAG TPA: histidine phosphatase family protein, partial [Chloroflexota bacterium]|nr:histidine phosphatase family protein [Chloroflexota bacterium]